MVFEVFVPVPFAAFVVAFFAAPPEAAFAAVLAVLFFVATRCPSSQEGGPVHRPGPRLTAGYLHGAPRGAAGDDEGGPGGEPPGPPVVVGQPCCEVPTSTPVLSRVLSWPVMYSLSRLR
ncbi:hypothetical protein GCM10027055_12550 [Janibacter alkaliphilus]